MGNHKKGICMADGGIAETPDQLMARMASKYGVNPSAQTQQPVPYPAPVPPPVQQRPQGIASGIAGIAGIFANRGKQIDKAAGYANGGIVKGKGTPTSDDVPVKINGQKYNLSDTEAVLPSKSRQVLGELLGAKPGDVAQANAAVEGFIENTNGKPPVTVNAGTNLNQGGLLGDDAYKAKYQVVSGINSPSPSQSAGRAPVTIADVPRPAGQAQVMRSKPASDAAPVSSPVVAQSKPVDLSSGPTVDDGAGGVYTPERGTSGGGILDGVVNLFKDSAQAARSGVHYDQVKANRLATENNKPLPQGDGSVQPPAGQAAFKQDPFSPTPDPMGVKPSADGQMMTGKSQYDGLAKTGVAIPDSSGGGFTDKGVSYNVNKSNQDGILKVTSSNTNPLYTNVKPEDAVTGLKNQMVGGDAAAVQEGLDRYARANAITQSIIDKQPMGGVGILGDGGIEAANAEKTARWRQDDLLHSAGRNPAAGQIAVASANGQNQQAIEELRQQGEAGRNAVAMRGQDLHANTELTRLAGNPLDNKIKQNQAESGQMANATAKQLTDLHAAYQAEQDPAKRKILAENIRVMSGKDSASKYLVVPGGEYTDPENPLVKMKAPSRVLDTSTGQFTDAQGGQKTAPAIDLKPGISVSAPDGTHTFQGKTIVVKNGKVTEVKNG